MRPPSPFQQQIADDIGDVFLNQDEYASLHCVEGKEILVVLAPDQRLPLGGGYTLGVSEASITLHARASDLSPRKEAGESLTVDGREYIIDQWHEHMGMAEVLLSQTITT